MKTFQSYFTILGILALGVIALPQIQEESTSDEDSIDGETVFVQVNILPSLPKSLA